MEGHSQPAKMAATLSFGHAQNLAGLGQHMNIGLPFPPTQHGRLPENRVAEWYHRNDGPWTPPGLAPPQGDIRNPSMLSHLRTSSLIFPSNQYRESIVSSECDTVPPGVIPSDSGYGSYGGAKHSVANGSVCDESLDRSPETQSLVGHINDLNFQSYSQDLMSKGGVSSAPSWVHSQPATTSSPTIDHPVNLDGIRICEICQKILKTKSEFKKHKQRHDKPFKCDVKDCSRREGFSTPNDLDRHKRSLHPDENAAGNRYRCPVGACKNKDKIWPRADNFRAHMKRVHQKELATDEDLDQYKVKPVSSSKEASDLARDSTTSEIKQFNAFSIENTNYANNWALPRSPVIDLSVEPSPTDGPSHIQMEEVNPNSESRLNLFHNATTRKTHTESDDTSFGKHMEMHRDTSIQPSPALDDADISKERQLEENEVNLHSEPPDSKLPDDMDSLGYHQINKVDESHNRSSESRSESPQLNRQPEGSTNINKEASATAEPRSPEVVDVDLTNRDGLLKLLEKLRSRGVLEEFGYRKEVPSETGGAKQEMTSIVTPEQAHVCSECKKRFNRRCELKKHEKRHLKPYGCTFPDCNKKFGSKNDWKRHENSQHFMLEHWRCDEKQSDGPSETCGKVIHRRELFKQHLGTWHHIKDQATLDVKLETCRVGRNCEARFWCGFCEEIIEIKKDGIQAWTERFNHIDDHFHGRNSQAKKEIGDWKEEGPPYPRAESSTNDSEGSAATSSTPNSSINSSNIHDTTGLEKRHGRTVNPKRKRDDGSDGHASKRAEIDIEEIAYYCCQCRDYMPVTSRQCANYPCEHKLCKNCIAAKS